MSRPARAPALDQTRTNHEHPDAKCFGSAEAEELLAWRPSRAGDVAYGVERFVEAIAGNTPVVILVPHGGYAAPAHVPDRPHGVSEPDIHTQELARHLCAAFAEHLGVPGAVPHIVLNRLRRGRLDMNRNEMDASGGHHLTRLAWRQFHAFARRAKREIAQGHSITNPAWNAASAEVAVMNGTSSTFFRGLVVDLHGQTHDRRNQLGYVLNQADLESHTDAQLDASAALRDKCSLRAAVAPASSSEKSGAAEGGTTLSSIVRGSRSLGALLESLGHPCVPSPTSPHAHLHGRPMYFNGGYNTCVHGSSVAGTAQREKERAADAAAAPAPSSSDPFDALFRSELEPGNFISVQLESAYEGHRETDAQMRRFAQHLAQALCTFAEWHVLREGQGEAWPKPAPTKQPNADEQQAQARATQHL